MKGKEEGNCQYKFFRIADREDVSGISNVRKVGNFFKKFVRFGVDPFVGSVYWPGVVKLRAFWALKIKEYLRVK